MHPSIILSSQVLCASVDPVLSRCTTAHFASTAERRPPKGPRDADASANVVFRVLILPFLELALRLADSLSENKRANDITKC